MLRVLDVGMSLRGGHRPTRQSLERNRWIAAAAAQPRNDTSGFTLIEILVVIFIIGIVTGVALLSVSRNENRQIKTFATELSQMVSMTEEEAMLHPQVMGITLDGMAVNFSSFKKDAASQKSLWLPVNDSVLSKYAIPDDVEISLHMGGKLVKLGRDKAPQIIFSTNGDVTPFILYVGKRGHKPSYAITADADGGVQNIALS